MNDGPIGTRTPHVAGGGGSGALFTLNWIV